MNKIILILTLLVFIGCDPEEEICQTCLLIEESNRNELELKRDGKANRFPQFTDQISVQNLGSTCSASKRSRLRNQETESTGPYCGETWTRRKRLECQ